MKQLISMAGEDHLLDPQEFRIVMHLVIQMADSREVTEIGVPKDDFYGFLKHEIDLKQGCETLPLTVLLFMSFSELFSWGWHACIFRKPVLGCMGTELLK